LSPYLTIVIVNIIITAMHNRLNSAPCKRESRSRITLCCAIVAKPSANRNYHMTVPFFSSGGYAVLYNRGLYKYLTCARHAIYQQ